MDEVQKLEDSLARAKVQAEYEALRPAVEGGTATDEERAKYRELNDELARLNTEFKTKYPPGGPVAADDAAPNPEPIAGGVSSVGGNGQEA